MHLKSGKSSTWVLLMIALLLVITAISCRKTELNTQLSHLLPGTWEFASMKLDGEEYLGPKVSSGKITFSSFSDGKGSFQQEIAFIGSGTDTMTGDAVLDEIKRELKLETDEKMILIKLSFQGTKQFTWESVQDSKPLIVKAKRKNN
jgi:hypothetical protein